MATNDRSRESTSRWAVMKIGTAVGLGYGALLILIESHYPGAKLETQAIATTIPALSAPVAIGIVLKGIKQCWFWIALGISSALHLFCVFHYLPLPTTLTAIVLGIIEAFVMAFITAVVRDKMESGGRRNVF